MVDEHGSIQGLAHRMGLSAVYMGRVLKYKEVPPNIARDLEFLSRGKVTAEQLCPHIFKPRWDEFKKLPPTTQRRIRRSLPKGA